MSDPLPGAAAFRLMQFNIEYGGELVDFGAVIRAIRAASPDVVALEEAMGNTARVADALGWPHHSARHHVVSTLPLIDPPEAGGHYLFVVLAPDRAVALANVHPIDEPYGPEQAAKGMEVSDLLALEERVRLPEVRPTLEALEPVIAAGFPTFLCGDFNAPSHLDWVAETVGARPAIRAPVPWPVSRAVEGAGFVDSFRAVHPDPLATPGLTWPAARRRLEDEWNPAAGDPHDRIDFVYAAGPARAAESIVVGEPGADGVDIAIEPWPTDHRAVVSSFEVDPAPLPTFVTVDHRLVEAGEPLGAAFHVAAGEAERVAIVEHGGPIDTVLAQHEVGGTDGEVIFSTDGTPSGGYDAVLISSGAERSRFAFRVQQRGAAPAIETDHAEYDAGEPVTATWHGAPGNRWDWVAIVPRGGDPKSDVLISRHTHTAIEGSAVFGSGGEGDPPLPAGVFIALLLADDGWTPLARADFSVRG